MTQVITDSANYTAIANAIRTQLGVQTTYLPSEMAAAVASISGGGSSLGTKTITENGIYDADDDNLDGYSSVTVNVPFPAIQDIEFERGGISGQGVEESESTDLAQRKRSVGYTPVDAECSYLFALSSSDGATKHIIHYFRTNGNSIDYISNSGWIDSNYSVFTTPPGTDYIRINSGGRPFENISSRTFTGVLAPVTQQSS